MGDLPQLFCLYLTRENCIIFKDAYNIYSCTVFRDVHRKSEIQNVNHT